MKKILSVCSIAVLGLTATNAIAAPSYLKKDANGGYNVTYDYTDKAKSGWYVGGRVGADFLNFDVKQDFTHDGASITDERSFEAVLAGDVFAGYKINYFWRAELELGYISQYEEKESGGDFSLSAPYLMLNGYYDFTNGVYVGAGVGAALFTTSFDMAEFVGGEGEKRTVSPMAGLMIGYVHELDYNLKLDLRYRLAGMMGHDVSYGYDLGSGVETFTADIDWLLENSISIGLRYEF